MGAVAAEQLIVILTREDLFISGTRRSPITPCSGAARRIMFNV
jgi:hypothetical protein